MEIVKNHIYNPKQRSSVKAGEAKKGIPILYIHKGYCPYLRLSLLQARKFNPSARIILLGDKANQPLAQEAGIEFYAFENYFSFANQFQKVYRHHSKNGYDYELFCFQRWFVLKEFVAKEKITGSFFYNDSDTFLFCDLEQLVTEWIKNYDSSICGPLAPCFVFYKNAAVLDEYCAFIQSHYEEEDKYRRLVAAFQQCTEEGDQALFRLFETVSDMTMLGLFKLEKNERIINLADVNEVKKGVFEENHYLRFHEEFRSRFPLGRKIKWIKNHPHYVTYDNAFVPVLGFHFQGHAKREMIKIFRGNKKAIPAKEYLAHQKTYYRFLLSNYKNKFLNIYRKSS